MPKPKTIADLKKRARKWRKPEARHRAPTGVDRVTTLVRMRRDLRDWLDARAAARTPANTRALELEIVLDEARLKDRTGS
jgi:hypothetical protein